MRFLTFILFFVFIESQAQYVFPSYSDSVKWNVLECFWGSCSTDVYQYKYDTSYCAETYSVIDFEFVIGKKWSFYIRSDSGTVYTRTNMYNNNNTNCSDSEQTIYDFNLNLYDTIFLKLGIGSWVIVDSIDYVSINGANRKRLFINEYSKGVYYYYNTTWIQGLGSDIHPLYFISKNSPGSEIDWKTLCVDSSGNKIYGPINYYGVTKTCDTAWYLGMDEFVISDMIISPNPNSGTMKVHTSNRAQGKIFVLNNQGQTVFKQYFDSEIDTNLELPNSLPNGFYHIKFIGEEFQTHGRFTLLR